MSFAFAPARARIDRPLSGCARLALVVLALCGGFLTHAPQAHAQVLSALPANVHNAGQTIYSVATQTDGKTVVSGVFSEIGTTPMTNIARFNTDGTLDTTFVAPQTDAFFQHMVISGNVLYVTGQFTTINGNARQRIAAINLLDGSLMGWDPAPDGDITTLAVNNGILYVGGLFAHIGGAARNSLAAFALPSNTILSWNPNATSGGAPDVISAIQPAGSSVYLAGYFHSVGNQPRLFLAQVDAAGGAVSAWNPQQSPYAFPMTLAYYNGTVFVGGEVDIGSAWYTGLVALDGTTGAVQWGESHGDVYDLWLDGSTVYADGAFSTLRGAARAGLGAFDAGTGSATAWNPVTAQPSNPVRVLGQSGNWLLLGGSAQAFDGAWTGPFIRVDTSTGAVGDTTPVRYRSLVNALLRQSDGKVLVGGRFTEINGVARQNIARLNADGSVDASWNPGVSYEVNALSATSALVYIATGNAATIGGQPRNFLGAVDAVSGATTAWNPSPNSYIQSLLYANNQLYVSGSFTTIGGGQRAGLASFDGPSGAITTFSAQPDGRVLAMAYRAGTLYIGGDFTHVSAQPHALLAAVDATTGTVGTWDPGALNGVGYAVEALDASGTQLLVGGYFQSMGGIGRPNLIGLNFSNARATAWTPGAVNGPVDAIVPANGTIYIGGGFTTIAGAQHTFVAAVDAGSGALHGNWAPSVDNGVVAVAPANGHVFVGGYFTTLGADARNALGAFTDVDTVFADGFQ